VPDNRPAIICSTISVFSKPIDAAFPLFARTGFDGIELMVTNDPDTQDATRVRALSDDHALPVLAVHAPFLLMSRRVWGRDPLGKIDRAIELALGIGAPLVVVHPPYRWQSEYRRWLVEALPNVAAERGVRVAVENMFPRCVTAEGNRNAQAQLWRVFRTVGGNWRGIAHIPNGNLRLRDEFAHLDARRRFDIDVRRLWEYAPATLTSFSARRNEVSGTCGPLQRSMKGPSV